MLVSYPALFYYDQAEKEPFFVTFPDFENSATQGKSVADAMAMAADWLGLTVADEIENNRELPKPSAISTLSLAQDNPFPDELHYDASASFVSMVLVNLDSYLDGNVSVKKTLTIPKWANQLGNELKLNFSQTLTDAIAAQKLPKDAQ